MKKKALQVDISKDVSEEDKMKFKKLIESINKTSLQNGKVLSIYISCDVNGAVSVINWGCMPKLQKKANFIGNNLADMIPEIMVCGDSRNVATIAGQYREEFDLVLTDPPYFDMMNRKKWGQKKKLYGADNATPFSDMEEDISNLDYENFLETLKDILASTVKLLKKNKYLIVFCRDLQPTDRWHMPWAHHQDRGHKYGSWFAVHRCAARQETLCRCQRSNPHRPRQTHMGAHSQFPRRAPGCPDVVPTNQTMK